MKQSDSMRSSIEKLTKRLNNSTEYIKQSEYTGKLEERNRLSQAIHDQIGHSNSSAFEPDRRADQLIGRMLLSGQYHAENGADHCRISAAALGA